MELKSGPGSRRFDYKQKLPWKLQEKVFFLRPQMYKGKRSLKERKSRSNYFTGRWSSGSHLGNQVLKGSHLSQNTPSLGRSNLSGRNFQLQRRTEVLDTDKKTLMHLGKWFTPVVLAEGKLRQEDLENSRPACAAWWLAGHPRLQKVPVFNYTLHLSATCRRHNLEYMVSLPPSW